MIAIHKNQEKRESYVYDLDTTLDFPIDFNEYVKKAIREEKLFQSQFHR